MTSHRLRFLLPLVLAAPVASAQSIGDAGARLAPQFYSYSLDAPSNTKISELAIPLFVVVPISQSLSFDVGTAFAQSRVQQTTTGGQSTTSTISGLTDTQIRANYVLGTDFVVLTAGVNLPTGRSTVAPNQLVAASLIGSDFLNFPVSNMGTGLGGTGGIAIARPLGDWNLGGGLSIRKSTEFTPVDPAGGATLRYQPGNEYRARVGVDRAFGTGRITLGLTYSTFGDDNLAGSVYNTGNRYLAQFSLDNTVGPGQFSLIGWNLFRTAGTLADSTYLPHDNITDAALSYGVNVGSMVVEPSIEGRTWFQANGLPASLMTVFGVRTQLSVAGFAVLPSVGYAVGRVASQTDTGLNTTASLTGFHAMLAIRVR